MDEPLKKNEKILEEARKRFQSASEAEHRLRTEAQDDIRFASGEQWDEFDRLQREEDGRPCLTINKVDSVLKQVIGDALKNRPRIKLRPVDSQGDPEKAKKLSGLIKNIENTSDAESAYDWGFTCAARGGFGYWKVTTDYADYDVFEQDIIIERVTNPFSILIDPSHRKPTGEDMRYAFELEHLTKEEFEERFPGKAPASWNIHGLDLAEDEDYVWICRYWHMVPVKRRLFQMPTGEVIEPKKPMVYEAPTEMGIGQFVFSEEMTMPVPYVAERTVDSHKVKHCLLSGAETLEPPQDWAGRYIPIVQIIGEEVWVDGQKHLRSVIHYAKDAQRLYNWSRSLAAETLAMAPRQPWLVTPETIEGHEDQWAVAHRKVMPYLLYNDGATQPPQRQMSAIPDTGAYQEAAAAADDIKATTGIYDASLGARSNETSGRAIMARQQEGDTATFVYHDNLNKAIRHTGRIIIDLIPKIYDTARVVRILNEDGSEEEFPVNQPIPGVPMLLNDLTLGKYDVFVDTGPSYATQRMETADAIVQILQTAPNLGPILIPRLVKVLDFPEAQEIVKEIQAMMAQSNQPSPEQQLQLQKDQLDLQNKQQIMEARSLNMTKDVIDIQQLGQKVQQIEQILAQFLGVAQ